ncbi:MAG: hypothetical protein RJQ04_08500 [Longimicrobiales bacterium]
MARQAPTEGGTMVMRGVKLAGLFVGYGLVGMTGDYAAGLWAQDAGPVMADRARVEAEPVVEVDLDLDLDLDDVRVDVRVGASDDCSFAVDRTASVPVGGASGLSVSSGSGDLRVEGRAGLDEVRVVGRACASEEDWIDDLRVTLERRGDELVLTTHYPDRDGRRSRSGRTVARIDLIVEVPLGMAADIEDSSGGMIVRGTGATRIDDSSGEIVVDGIRGSLTIDDSSGGIDVRDVGGAVRIDDGSGEIEVSAVRGPVTIADGSGSIDVVEVDQDVVVERDGSGSISVRDIQGGFSVLRDGSGSIRHSGVAGAVDVPEKKRRNRRGN